MERDLIERYEAACELSKEVSELKEELRKEILAAAAAEVRAENLPHRHVAMPQDFFATTGLTEEEFLAKTLPGWEVQGESHKGGHGYYLRKQAKYGNYSTTWDDLSVDVRSAESSPEVDWDTLEKEYPELVDKIGVPEIVYRLDETRLEEANKINSELPQILERHVKIKAPVMRVKVKRTPKKCTCSKPTYYNSPEGAKGHCTCGAL